MRFGPTCIVLALGAAPVFAQTMAPPSPETERIVMRHMAMVEKGDLKTMLEDMSDPVTLIGPSGARVFTKADMLKRFSEQFSKPDHIELQYKAFAGNIGYVIYTVNPGKPGTHQFAETFFIQGGKIFAYSNSQFQTLLNVPQPAQPAKK
jgi:hypothetical protein